MAHGAHPVCMWMLAYSTGSLLAPPALMSKNASKQNNVLDVHAASCRVDHVLLRKCQPFLGGSHVANQHILCCAEQSQSPIVK